MFALSLPLGFLFLQSFFNVLGHARLDSYLHERGLTCGRPCVLSIATEGPEPGSFSPSEISLLWIFGIFPHICFLRRVSDDRRCLLSWSHTGGEVVLCLVCLLSWSHTGVRWFFVCFPPSFRRRCLIFTWIEIAIFFAINCAALVELQTLWLRSRRSCVPQWTKRGIL